VDAHHNATKTNLKHESTKKAKSIHVVASEQCNLTKQKHIKRQCVNTGWTICSDFLETSSHM